MFCFNIFLTAAIFVSGNGHPEVFLTLSSLASSTNFGITQRQIEMNWFGTSQHWNESWIGLFNHDPSESIEDPLERIDATNETSGYLQTYFMFPKLTFNPENLTNDCLFYWIAYITNNYTVSSSCYRIHPNWMYELGDFIRNQSVHTLMIPGTHNSGCYLDYSPLRDSILNRYIMTQDESIWNQLVYGNRYLDFRISYMSGIFWITHSIFRTDIMLSDALEQVKQFLNVTKEIVILDFHRFENGFQQTYSDIVHQNLIQYLEEKLSDIMIPINYRFATIGTLWETNKRLYVGYANSARNRSNYLFPGISHQWANADTVHDLEVYFNDTVCKRRRPNLQSSMAHLTPQMAGIVFDTYGGIRTMAQSVNIKVSQWFRERWWNCANIVATDYFHGNNIIEIAIEANKRRWTDT